MADLPLTIETDLAAWLAARADALGGAVYPHTATPADELYCTFRRVSTTRWNTLKGHSGVTVARVQLDFRGPDHAALRAVADRVAGTRADPGLDCFKGYLAEGGRKVQSARRLDEAEDYEESPDGREAGRFVITQDYKITFEE